MKILLSLFTIFSFAFLQAQNKDVIDKNSFIYNNGKDTIQFSNANVKGFCQPFSITIKDTVQIDGMGRKEIVFAWSSHCSVSEHGGTFDIDENISISKYEIWNLDTKEMLFDINTFYSNHFNKFLAYSSPSHLKGFESYSCSFAIDSLGVITIGNVKVDANVKQIKWSTIKKNGKEKSVVHETPYPFYTHPNKKEGTYHFIGGKYILE